MSDGLEVDVSSVLTSADGSTIQAIEELLKPLVARYAIVFEMYSSLSKAMTAAKRNGYTVTEAGISQIIKPVKSQRDTLAKVIKVLRARIKVLEFIKLHLGGVYTLDAWFLEVTSFMDHDGDLAELRHKIGLHPDLRVRLGYEFDEQAASRLVTKLERKEKDLHEVLDQALLFLASHGVIAYSSEQGKVVLPDHLAE